MCAAQTKNLFPSFRKDWTTKFSFPQVPPRSVGPLAFYWTPEGWRKGSSTEMWVLPGSNDADPDPPVNVKLKDGKARLITKAGFSYSLPPESIQERLVGDDSYVIVNSPGVYEVFWGVSKHNVLAFWGYNQKRNSVGLFSPSGLDPSAYKAECMNPAFFVEEEDDSDQERTSPTYAPAYQSASDGTVDSTTPEGVKRRMSSISKKILPIFPVHSVEYMKEQERLLKDKSELVAKYNIMVGPTNEGTVEAFTVLDGKITKVERHRSSLGEDGFDLAKQQGAEEIYDPISEVRKKLKMKEGDPMPMPI